MGKLTWLKMPVGKEEDTKGDGMLLHTKASHAFLNSSKRSKEALEPDSFQIWTWFCSDAKETWEKMETEKPRILRDMRAAPPPRHVPPNPWFFFFFPVFQFFKF